jgi:hypothetical protein
MGTTPQNTEFTNGRFNNLNSASTDSGAGDCSQLLITVKQEPPDSFESDECENLITKCGDTMQTQLVASHQMPNSNDLAASGAMSHPVISNSNITAIKRFLNQRTSAWNTSSISQDSTVTEQHSPRLATPGPNTRPSVSLTTCDDLLPPFVFNVDTHNPPSTCTSDSLDHNISKSAPTMGTDMAPNHTATVPTDQVLVSPVPGVRLLSDGKQFMLAKLSRIGKKIKQRDHSHTQEDNQVLKLVLKAFFKNVF